jgi:hypothetical protein
LRAEASSVLSPFISAIAVWGASYAVSAEVVNPVLVASALTLGYPIAVIVAVLSSIYLRRRLVSRSWISFLVCAAWGAFLATLVSIFLFGASPLTVALASWGAASGFLYRWLTDVDMPISSDG